MQVGPCSRGQNDAVDAEAIFEVVSRTSMRFVPVKTLDNRSVLTPHRARQGSSRRAPRTVTRSAGCSQSSVS
jgi:transposase